MPRSGGSGEGEAAMMKTLDPIVEDGGKIMGEMGRELEFGDLNKTEGEPNNSVIVIYILEHSETSLGCGKQRPLFAL